MKIGFVLLLLLAITTCGFASSLYYYLAGIWGPEYAGGQLGGVYFMAVGLNGNLYCSDYFRDRVVVFSPTGSYLGQWGSTGSGPGRFHSPQGIDTDSEGNIFVADTNNSRIQKFTANGQFLTEWGVLDGGSIPVCPNGLTVGLNGNIYIASTEVRSIIEYTPAGGFVRSWGPLFGGPRRFLNPYSLAISSNGDVLVTDTDYVFHFTAEGEYLHRFFIPGTSVLRGICISSNDVVYLNDETSNSIKYYTIDGILLGSIPYTTQMLCWRAVATVDGSRVYAGDGKICYFDQSVVVEPQSLGMIKGLYH